MSLVSLSIPSETSPTELCLTQTPDEGDRRAFETLNASSTLTWLITRVDFIVDHYCLFILKSYVQSSRWVQCDNPDEPNSHEVLRSYDTGYSLNQTFN